MALPLSYQKKQQKFFIFTTSRFLYYWIIGNFLYEWNNSCSIRDGHLVFVFKFRARFRWRALQFRACCHGNWSEELKFRSFDATWSLWSWITNPNPDPPKGTPPKNAHCRSQDVKSFFHEAELAITISHPTSASGIIVSWKMPQNIDKSSQLCKLYFLMQYLITRDGWAQ